MKKRQSKPPIIDLTDQGERVKVHTVLFLILLILLGFNFGPRYFLKPIKYQIVVYMDEDDSSSYYLERRVLWFGLKRYRIIDPSGFGFGVEHYGETKYFEPTLFNNIDDIADSWSEIRVNDLRMPNDF